MATDQLRLEDLLHTLFKHFRKIIVIFLSTLAVTAAVTFLATPIYEANASLLVKVGREFMSSPEVGDSTNVMAVDQKEIINSVIEVLKSRELLFDVVREMGVATLYPTLRQRSYSKMSPEQEAVTKLTEDFEAKGITDSNVIALRLRLSDSDNAVNALSVLIDHFKEKHLEVFTDPRSSFVEQQLKDFRARLTDSEGALQRFKQAHQIYALDEQRTLLLNQRVDLDSDLKRTLNRVEELQRIIVTYREQLRRISQDSSRYTPTDRENIVVDAQKRLLDLELQLQQLLSKDFREDSRTVSNVRREIELVRQFLHAQETDIKTRVKTGNPVFQEVEKELLKANAELVSQRAGAAVLGEQLAQLDKEIQVLDQKESELRNLQRAVEVNEKNYLTYVEKHEEALISDELNRQKIANISVIQPPYAEIEPVKPRTLLNLILGTLFGAILSLTYAFFVESASQSLSTPKQVERRLGLPVLVSIGRKD